MLTLNFSPFPLLQTERLTLRKINIEDADDIFLLRSDDRVNKFIDRPKAQSLDDAKNFINQIRSRVSNNELLYWAITQKKDSKLIGTIVIWNLSPKDSCAEVGFELLPDFQGQGLMREALIKVIEYGFTQLKLQVLEALPEERNERSIALLEREQFKQNPSFVHPEPSTGHDFKTMRYTLSAADFSN